MKTGSYLIIKDMYSNVYYERTNGRCTVLYVRDDFLMPGDSSESSVEVNLF